MTPRGREDSMGGAGAFDFIHHPFFFTAKKPTVSIAFAQNKPGQTIRRGVGELLFPASTLESFLMTCK